MTNSYYLLSVMLGTVALSYGSVPMYKMVQNILIDTSILTDSSFFPSDMPAEWLGRPTRQIPKSRFRRRSCCSSAAGHFLAPAAHHLQRIGVGCDAMEVHSSAAGSARLAGRDCTGVLYSNEQERGRYHWSGHLQRHSPAGRTLFQQNPMLLF